jgi:signal transduction protein with GAF and PtsI domain
MVSGTYLSEILQLIVTMTAQTMNSKICSLMFYDEKTQELKIAATQSLSEDYKKKPPLKLEKSIAGRVVKEKSAISIRDVTVDPRYSYPEIARKEGLKSMLAVPMLLKGRPIGVINCYTTIEHIFTDDETAMLQTIANQAALAIENTRLLEESQSAKEALENRKVIERAKGILMRQRGISESEAFQFVQRQAMNMRRTMKEIAEAILLSDGITNP